MAEGPGGSFNPADLARLDPARIKGYQRLLDFYHSMQWEGREKWGEKRLTFNYAKVVVDKVTSYLMSGMAFGVDPGADTEEAREAARRAERALRRVHHDNAVEQLDFETEIDCAALGDACYKLSWDPEAKGVRITAPDIQGIYVWRLGDDTSRVWRVASRYQLTADEVDAIYGMKPRGKEAAVVEVWTDREFGLWVDARPVEMKPNPYGFIPFVVFPNLREPKQFWGVSDLAQIMEPQREFNRAMSQLSRILELSGNPIAVLENVEESEDIAVRPGAVWNVPEDAKAYLLDLLQGGGLRLHIDYINLLYRTLHDVSESPRAAFGGTERDLSGVALEMELQPLLQKVQRKRTIRSGVYARRSQMILRLLERYQGEDFSGCLPRVMWGPLLPRDMQKLVANEQTLVQGGIHARRTAMLEMGVADPEAEFGRWLEERAAILGMNRELKGRTRGGESERGGQPRGSGVDE